MGILSGITFAQGSNDSASTPKYLHISTNPAGTDIYINNIRPDHTKQPDLKTPGFVEIFGDEASVTISLFHPEYADTTINVQLSKNDTSFLIISQRSIHNEQIIEKQINEIKHRNRKSQGKKLLFASIVPIVVGGVSAFITNYEANQADKKKKDIEASLINDEERHKANQKKFNNYQENANTAKNITKVSLVLGGLVLATGIILSF